MKKVYNNLNCPICGEINNCALAKGEENISKCWCYNLEINQDTLNKGMDKKSCICSTCISKPNKKLE